MCIGTPVTFSSITYVLKPLLLDEPLIDRRRFFFEHHSRASSVQNSFLPCWGEKAQWRGDASRNEALAGPNVAGGNGTPPAPPTSPSSQAPDSRSLSSTHTSTSPETAGKLVHQAQATRALPCPRSRPAPQGSNGSGEAVHQRRSGGASGGGPEGARPPPQPSVSMLPRFSGGGSGLLGTLPVFALGWTVWRKRNAEQREGRQYHSGTPTSSQPELEPGQYVSSAAVGRNPRRLRSNPRLPR